jgi:hypothetical protein
VFAGFLDIAKAYPSVWRNGLWFKLLEVGVRGRMWRVLRTLYAHCEVAVRVGGVADDWYEEFVGVREGCVVSPLLFAIYINGLPALLDEGGAGSVKVGGAMIRCLMFADDVVMLADTAAGLQRSFELAGWYGWRWRFKFNFGEDKSAVMVFGGAKKGEKWVLEGREVPVVTSYRYLGVRLVPGRRGKWKERRKELMVKARGAFWRAWGLGMAGGWLSARGAKGLWETLVLSVLGYGAEVDSGKWEEAETMQRWAGRMCLGVGREVPNEAVMGDLGWWTVQGRREYLRLAYWGKVVRERKTSVVRVVYEEGRRRMEAGKAGRGEWCVETARLLREMGMGEEWDLEKVGGEREWKAMVRGMVQGREEDRWRVAMTKKVTLESYVRVKPRLKAEWFLGEGRVWVRRWVRLRAGASCLEVVAGRRRGVARDKRVCGWCGVVEDERHFLDVCKRWASVRREAWETVRLWDEEGVKRVAGWGSQARVDWLLGGGSAKTRRMVVKLVGAWVAQREKVGCGRLGSGRWGEELSGFTRKRVQAVQVARVKSVARRVGVTMKKVWLARIAHAQRCAAAGARKAALAAMRR